MDEVNYIIRKVVKYIKNTKSDYVYNSNDFMIYVDGTLKKVGEWRVNGVEWPTNEVLELIEVPLVCCEGRCECLGKAPFSLEERIAILEQKVASLLV